MLAGFKNFDPAVEKKLACHSDLPKFACAHAHRTGTTKAQRAVRDLVLIAYYYLLRVGEYTKNTRRKLKTRTRQFRLNDTTFYKKGSNRLMQTLPLNATEADIMTVNAATLQISNKKNGHAGQCVHTWANVSSPEECPICALGRRAIHIRKYSRRGGVLLCSFWEKVGHAHVTNKMISYTVKYAAGALHYPTRGTPLARVDTHSLRSGGACALSLAGYKEHQITKMGRWAPRLTAFMEYIQQQLSIHDVWRLPAQGPTKKARRRWFGSNWPRGHQHADHAGH